MEESARKAIVEITALRVRASEFDNEIASDDLKFSVWVAAFATAGFGFVLLNANKIIETSWLPSRVGTYLIVAIQVTLAAAILGAGLVRHSINARLQYERAYINLLNAQLVRIFSGHITPAGDDIVENIFEGKYLQDDGRAKFHSYKSKRNKLHEQYHRRMKIQIVLTGLALVGLLIIGLRFRPGL